MSFKIIDAHSHCGCLDRFPQQDIGDYASCLGGSGIKGVVMFSPVFEIYDRCDPDFKDTASWRQRRAASNKYLLSAGAPGLVRGVSILLHLERFCGGATYRCAQGYKMAQALRRAHL